MASSRAAQRPSFGGFGVKDAPASGLLSLTEGDRTTRSGLAAGGAESVVAVATWDAVPVPAELMADTRRSPALPTVSPVWE